MGSDSRLAVRSIARVFLLTLRFYLGTLRFGTTEPKRVDFLIKSFNFIFAFAVFCAFYAIALSVTKIKFYYLQIVILHGIDAAWFGLLYGLSHLKYVDEPQLESGELYIGPVRRIMAIYFWFSAITVAFGVLVYPLGFGASLTDPTATVADWSFLAFLVLMSGIDFWALHDYYFYFDDWRRNHAKK